MGAGAQTKLCPKEVSPSSSFSPPPSPTLFRSSRLRNIAVYLYWRRYSPHRKIPFSTQPPWKQKLVSPGCLCSCPSSPRMLILLLPWRTCDAALTDPIWCHGWGAFVALSAPGPPGLALGFLQKKIVAPPGGVGRTEQRKAESNFFACCVCTVHWTT